MRHLFENIDDESQGKTFNYRKRDKVSNYKFTIEDVHYMMHYHLHI